VRVRRAGVCAGLGALVWAVLVATPVGAAPASGGDAPVGITPSSFTSNFAAMKEFRGLASRGRGKIAAILPDTTTSPRYVESDQPDLTTALTAAGLAPAQYTVQNAQGNDATELGDAEADIDFGATVLIVDPIDSGVGTQIEAYAGSKGVKVIDYNSLSLGGSRAYFVGYNDVEAGRLMGQGLESCVAAWHIAKPEALVMTGAAYDPTASELADGYTAALASRFKSGKWTEVAPTIGTWNPPAAASEFQAASAADPTINAVVVADDETGVPIIAYLQQHGVKPKSVALTGFDASLPGLQNVLSGYQCGTVYEPVAAEAQAAVALALYLRDGKKPPRALVNGSVEDTTSQVSVPSVLVTPEWITAKNMRTTVINDGYVTTSELCAAPYTADCAAAGIKP
jgi:D-xylose transport system substrate-binding protein